MSELSTLIVSGGRIDHDFALLFLKTRSYQRVIAVDGGLSFCAKAGVIPTDIVGDFDTVDAGLLAEYERRGEAVIRKYMPEKDDTDSEIAVKLALEYGSTQIDLIGASGTRLDHTIGNIRLLGMLHREAQKAGQRIAAAIYDENNRIRLVEGELVLEKGEAYGRYVSLLPFTQRAEGITLTGFRYPLKNHTMDMFEAPTLGISNEIVAEQGKITVKSGILLLIESRD